MSQLYFITDLRKRYVKIGISKNSLRRLDDLQAGSPLPLRLELILRDCGRREEEILHYAFRRHWRHREWFDYAADIRTRVEVASEVGFWEWTDLPDIEEVRRDAANPSHGLWPGKNELMASRRRLSLLPAALLDDDPWQPIGRLIGRFVEGHAS